MKKSLSVVLISLCFCVMAQGAKPVCLKTKNIEVPAVASISKPNVQQAQWRESYETKNLLDSMVTYKIDEGSGLLSPTDTKVYDLKHLYLYGIGGGYSIYEWESNRVVQKNYDEQNNIKDIYYSDLQEDGSIGGIYYHADYVFIDPTGGIGQKKIHSVVHSWYNNSWRYTAMEKSQYHYDEETGDLLSSVTEVYDEVASQWSNNKKFEYSTTDGRYSSVNYSTYNTETSEWEIQNTQQYNYDDHGNVISVNYYSAGATLKSATLKSATPYKVSSYEYDANGNPVLELYSSFNNDSNKQVDYSKYLYTYDLEHGYENLVAPAKREFVPDFNDAIKNMPLEVEAYSWDTIAGDWALDHKYVYFYTSVEVEASLESKAASSMRLYPNPCSDFLFLESAIAGESVVFKVFDLQGHALLSYALEGELKVDVSLLNSGAYFYTLSSQLVVKRGQFIKQ